MPHILNVENAFPKFYYDQNQLLDGLQYLWQDEFFNKERLGSIFQNCSVGSRHLAREIEWYKTSPNFEERNETWQNVSLDLTEEMLSKLIEGSGIDIDTIGLLASSTVTGLSVPSLEAKIMNKIPFKSSTKRLPIFGLGCLAGVAGINRVGDYLKGHPKEAAIFFSVELCSLTIQKSDLSVANMISSGLFGDGAGAVLMVGDEHPLASKANVKWTGGQSHFFQNSERVMGWDFGQNGFKIVLNSEVPRIAKEEIPPIISDFLKESELEIKDVSRWIGHPGGPKVLQAIECGLELPANSLAASWKSLLEKGNMSSVSVLNVLYNTLREDVSRHEFGLMFAMGPAFCAEVGGLRWN